MLIIRTTRPRRSTSTTGSCGRGCWGGGRARRADRVAELDDRTAELRLIADGRRVTGAVLELDAAPAEEARPVAEPSLTAGERVAALVGSLLEGSGAVAVRGEAGTGKRHLLLTALAGRGAEPVVLDAAALPALGFAAWAAPLRSASAVLLARRPAVPRRGRRRPRGAAGRERDPGDGNVTGRTSAHLTRLLDAVDATVVELPPLRLRREEVAVLAADFAGPGRRWCPRAGRAGRPFLAGQRGQFRLVVREAVAAAAGRPVDLVRTDLPPGLRSRAGARRLTLLEKAEAAVIGDVLAATGGNKTAAARQLGLSRPTLYAKLRAYRI